MSTPTAHAPVPRTLILEACTKQLAHIDAQRLWYRHQAQEEKLGLIRQERDRKVLGLFPVKHAKAPDEIVWEKHRNIHSGGIFSIRRHWVEQAHLAQHYRESERKEILHLRSLAEKCDGDHVHLTTEGVRLLRL